MNRHRQSVAILLTMMACSENAARVSPVASHAGGTSSSGGSFGVDAAGSGGGGAVSKAASGAAGDQPGASGAPSNASGSSSGGANGGQLGQSGSGFAGVASEGGRSSGGSAAGGSVSGGLGGAVSAGSGGSPSSAGGGATETGPFMLLFRDEFDTLDLGRWQLMTHSWATNLALFSASAANVEGGALRLSLTPAPAGTVDDQGVRKSFLGAEVRSREAVTYGRVRARARLATGSAVVSALVTIYTPWPADDWNELDMECLGANPSNVQFNAMVYTGPPLPPPVTQSVTPTQHPAKVALGFDPSADYHVYTIEWTPSGARFLVDDVLRHTWSERADLLGLPQNTLLTIWASSSADWAGAVTAETGRASASYDWVELYRYMAP